ncbi:hypothetical protein D3C81_1031120 [compost metagenome]
MAADGDVGAAQAVGLGESGDILEQPAEGIGGVVLGIVSRANGGHKVVDGVADGVANQVFPRAAGAAKGDAQAAQLASSVILAEDLDLGTGVAGGFAMDGATKIRAALIAQLLGADRRPACGLDCGQGLGFGVGVPGETGDRALAVGAANQRLDQGGGQAEAETVLLVANGEAVVDAVVGIQAQRHGVAVQGFGSGAVEVAIIENRHGIHPCAGGRKPWRQRPLTHPWARSNAATTVNCPSMATSRASWPNARSFRCHRWQHRAVYPYR